MDNQVFYRKGELSEVRINALNELGFEWSPKSRMPNWEDRLGELRQFKAQHGHCNVSQNSCQLGEWANTQRKRKRQGKLPAARQAALEEIGFLWELNNNMPSWDERYHELEQYRLMNGDCNVPKSHKTLGKWVSNQRQRRSKMSKERVQKMVSASR